MPQQERASIIAVVTNLLVNGWVLVRLSHLHRGGALSGDDAVAVWATTVLWAVPANIVVTVVLTVLAALALRGEDGGSIVDERDRLFRLRGMSMTSVVFGVGFTGSVVGLAFGWPAVGGLFAIYLTCAVADLVGQLVRLVSYRLGS